MAENRDEIGGYYDGVANPQIPQITQINNHLKDEGITCRNPLNAKSVGFNYPAARGNGKDKAAMSHKTFIERMDLIDRLKAKPEKFLSEANIHYLAPADAADIGLPDASVDYHIATTVFEHIPKVDSKRILKESRRILKKDGVAIHFIDLSDHFQHQDKSITKINFLRYSDEEWNKIAGNEFAYCNRLRASDYFALFDSLGFDICRKEVQEDKEARERMRYGFKVDEGFRGYNVDDLCVTGLKVALKVGEKKNRG